MVLKILQNGIETDGMQILKTNNIKNIKSNGAYNISVNEPITLLCSHFCGTFRKLNDNDTYYFQLHSLINVHIASVLY